jgi:hypothetical protein
MKRYTRNATFRFATVVLFSLLALASIAVAQLPVPASSQFDITGFIQVATLGGPGTGAGTGAHQGGNIIINGHLITVPSETIVILPANLHFDDATTNLLIAYMEKQSAAAAPATETPTTEQPR